MSTAKISQLPVTTKEQVTNESLIYIVVPSLPLGDKSRVVDVQTLRDILHITTIPTQKTIATTAHTIEPSDSGALLVFTNDNNIVVTINTNAQQAVPTLSVITLIQKGLGRISVVSEVGVELMALPGSWSVGQGQFMQLLQEQVVDNWILVGGVEE